MEGQIRKMERADLIRLFLKKNKLDKADFEWMPSDASFRHYARIKTKDKSYILMDAPPPEIPEQFAVVDEILCKNDLSAPVIYDADFENGFILLEDFGDASYNTLLADGFNELELYKTSLNALLQVAKIKDYTGIPPYDKDWLFEGLSVFIDWFIPNAINRNVTEAEKEAFFKIWETLFNTIENYNNGLILNDFHLANMMLLDREKHRTCGLLDFQDARVGPLSYDLVSLLEDARRDKLSEETTNKLFDLYFEAQPDLDKELFMRSYHIMAVKRHTRVIGVFVRLKARDGKDKYLKHIPNVWRLLESHLDEPYLADFKNWLDAVVPKEYRKIPSCLEN